ncbi:MAG: anti-sigma factor [Anaerolineales bacterium]
MDNRLEDLLSFYALGTLTDSERAEVEAYIAVNGEARERLWELQAAAEALATATTPVQPSPALKSRLMARVHADVRQRVVTKPQTESGLLRFFDSLRQRFAPALAVGGLALAVAAAAWALTLNAEVIQLRAQLATQNELATQVAELKLETESLRQELQEQNKVLAHLASPGSYTVSIAGTAQLPEAYGQLINDPTRHTTVLVISGLPQLEPGKVYQFWWIKGETPIAAETFAVDEQGRAVVEVSSAETPTSYNAMGVTVEPAGGSQQPTTQPIMLGQIS